MALSEQEVQNRVEEAVRTGNFFFPEDVVRGIAEKFGIDLQNTPYGKVAPADSPTRGDVHPDRDEAIEYVRTSSRKAAGKEDVPTGEDPGLETEVVQSEGDPTTENTGDTETEDDYDSWSGADLEAELRERELPVSGTNAEKAARLRENDGA